MDANIAIIFSFAVFIFFVGFVVYFIKHLLKASPEIFICKKVCSAHGIDISEDQLRLHKDAGGNVINVMKKIVEAKQSGREISFDTACALDLAEASGLDIEELKRNSKL